MQFESAGVVRWRPSYVTLIGSLGVTPTQTRSIPTLGERPLGRSATRSNLPASSSVAQRLPHADTMIQVVPQCRVEMFAGAYRLEVDNVAGTMPA